MERSRSSSHRQSSKHCWNFRKPLLRIMLLLLVLLDICRCFSNNQYHLIFRPLLSLTVQRRIRNGRTPKDLPLKGLINHNNHDALSLPTTHVVPLKVMIFIDGTWLYYSIYEREYYRDVIAQKLGRNWKNESTPDWSNLPRAACQALMNDPKSSWSAIMPIVNSENTTISSPATTVRPIEVSRVMVYSSMHRDTHKDSFRYQMFSEMSKAGFDVNMMETVGKGEKCVDIQLAVDMLYYATVPDAYDVALLLTGDRDFLPAVIRCRQKGRRIGIVGMRTGTLAFEDTPNLKDYDTIYLEDYIDEWIRKKKPHEMSDSSPVLVGNKRSHSFSTNRKKQTPKISLYTLNLVIKNFMEKSGKPRVSSRDIGRHLKELNVDGRTILDEIKAVYGGLYQLLYLSETYLIEADSRRHIKAYWVSLNELKPKDNLDDVGENLSEDEKKFINVYGQRSEKDKNKEYEFTIRDSDQGYDILSLHSNATATLATTDLKSESPSVDYNTFTVVELKKICREKGLKVTARQKIELIERIEQHIASEKQQVKSTIGDLKPEKYLESTFLEYLYATGGQASSRDVGRYMAANKASYERRLVEAKAQEVRPISALVELKEIYGSLNSFVKQFSYLSIKKNSSQGREFCICIEDSALKTPSVEGTITRK
mmetsp:Transcript_20390/g.22737  ORF Transcript_20390/g.22737 Transcript_20390/m.22737 type:complete len:652 (-) Transcript_20390:563-2518(-)